MQQNEAEFLAEALKPIASNRHAYLSSREFLQLDEDLRTKWYAEAPRLKLSCPHCPNGVLERPAEEMPYGICVECRSIVPLTEADLKVYRFKFVPFLSELQKELGMPSEEVKSFKSLAPIGSLKHKKDQWLVVFAFSRTLIHSLGTLLEFQAKHDAPFTLLLVDEVPDLEESDLLVLETCGIFFLKWSEASKSVLNRIYADYEAKLKLRQHLLSLNAQNKASAVASALRVAATTAAGDPFEEEVFGVCQHLFETALPFGGSLKGVAIPDGLLTDTTSAVPLPILFYDCKSFKGDAFKHKAEIPMQVNYYQDFLEDFFSADEYKNAGFIIFSSSYPDQVKSSIEGSAQWRYVQEKCTIFFVDVDSLERVKDLISRYGHSVDRRTFLDICFLAQTSKLNDPETQGYYEKLFPASEYSKFRFLTADQFEVAYVSALVNDYKNRSRRALAGLDDGLKETIRKAQHEKKKSRVRSTVLPEFADDFIQAMKNGTTDSFLTPLSRLLILNRLQNLLLLYGEDQYDDEHEHVVELLDQM